MKVLTKYLKKREAALDYLLAKPKHKYAMGTFHKLRVEIKKLNALFNLINACEKKFKKRKAFKPFKLIFKQAGKVRKLQLEEAILEQYLSNDSLYNFRKNLKRQLLKEQEIFFSIKENKYASRLKNKLKAIAPFLAGIDTKKVNSYLDTKKKGIEKLLRRKTINTPQMHELRKRLKMFNYNRRSLTLNKNIKADSKKDTLTGLLGKWHDCMEILTHIQKAIQNEETNTKEINHLKNIQTKIFQENKKLVSKINKIMPASANYK